MLYIINLSLTSFGFEFASTVSHLHLNIQILTDWDRHPKWYGVKKPKNSKVSIYSAFLLLPVCFVVANNLLIKWYLFSTFSLNHYAFDTCFEDMDES